MLVGKAVSAKITKDYKNYIYKQDTEEVRLIKRVLSKLIEANQLQRQFINKNGNELEIPIDVTLVHNDTIIMFMNLDQRLFITIPLLQLANMNEE
jgi:cellobiose-specific phosphotransferase system component IIA